MSFPLALQPTSQQEEDQLSLQHFITRINEERGAFRNVTEGKLREEVIKDARNIEDDLDEAEESEPVQDVESRRKEVFAARNEMLNYIG
jgi:mediator of RNA polymerase II transcription subunit 17